MVLAGTKEGMSLTRCAVAAKADSDIAALFTKQPWPLPHSRHFWLGLVALVTGSPSSFVLLPEVSEFQGLLLCSSRLLQPPGSISLLSLCYPSLREHV